MSKLPSFHIICIDEAYLVFVCKACYKLKVSDSLDRISCFKDRSYYILGLINLECYS